MLGKQNSGYCRSLVLAVLFLLLFCSAVAVAADCQQGCSCLQPAVAEEKGYDPCSGQLTVCGYDLYQKPMFCYKTPLSITLRTIPPLSVVTATTTQPGTCPSGCSCMMESEAREKFGTYSRCSETPCYTVVTGSATLKAYCFRQGTTTPVPSCPEGCSCISDATAKARGGTWIRCTAEICGYEQSTATLAAVVNVPKYCMKQQETTPVCPEGCVCLTDADAKARYGDYTRCSSDICGYAPGAVTNALSANQVPKYCVKQTTTPPVCPEGCVCLSDEKAKARYGEYTRCSAEACGKEIIQPVGAAAYSVPQYCVKQGSTPVCPDGCVCISDEDAKLKGLTERCDNSQTPCGYKTDTSTTTALRRIPLYCYKLPTTTPACPEGCSCLSEVKAKERYGTFTRCTEEICGKEVIPAASGVAAYSVPQYCVKQGSTPVCPDGCACISDEDAKLKGLTERCDNSQTPCGYRSLDATATTAAQRIPLYCYKIPTTTPVCPQGCSCIQEAEARLKFGPNNYTRCQADPCGYDPSATTANGIPRYCFKPAVTPTPPACPQGCVCTTDEIAKIKGLTSCRGVRTSCGYDKQQPLYCFEQVPSPTCIYDYQKNVCSGTCPEGYTCGLLASRKDATGKVDYAICGCTGQPTGQCTFDKERNTCTGACQNGGTCAIVGKKVDDTTGEVSVVCGCPPPSTEQCAFDREKQTCTGTCQSGAACTVIGRKTDDAGNVYVFCGCPQPTSCTYDYSKDACAGTCTGKGEICQLNTIYRDPTTGKVTYAECHCKGGGDIPQTCTCDPATGACSGTCADGKVCTMTGYATDNAGKIFCSVCECRDTCVLTADNVCSGTCPDGEPCKRIVTKDDSGQEKVSCGCGGISPAGTPAGVAPRPPGIFESIASFFNKLFGGK